MTRIYKVEMKYPDGTTHEEDEVFETEEEAREYGADQINNYVVGGEVLHMSNPGDYPDIPDIHDVDFEVIEVDV